MESFGGRNRAGLLSEACDEMPLEAVEKHARTVQSWLDVQRARGGQAENAKAFFFPQRRLHEAKEAQAQKKATKQLEREEKAAKARQERRASCAEELRKKAEKQRKDGNQRRKDARKRVKEAVRALKHSGAAPDSTLDRTAVTDSRPAHGPCGRRGDGDPQARRRPRSLTLLCRGWVVVI